MGCGSSNEIEMSNAKVSIAGKIVHSHDEYRSKDNKFMEDKLEIKNDVCNASLDKAVVLLKKWQS